MLQKTGLQAEISVNLVRSVQDLQVCDALVIPGGGMSPIPCRPLLLLSPYLAESTTIALLAKLSGLLDPLREFLKTKPVWGSCAGAILMSRNVTNAKTGGQDLLGGLSVTTARNGWGSQVGPRSGSLHYCHSRWFIQVESFEVPLVVQSLSHPDRPFQGVFIRAPVLPSPPLA
jgi:5'-phosphate synthase pdxT subunit